MFNLHVSQYSARPWEHQCQQSVETLYLSNDSINSQEVLPLTTAFYLTLQQVHNLMNSFSFAHS